MRSGFLRALGFGVAFDLLTKRFLRVSASLCLRGE